MLTKYRGLTCYCKTSKSVAEMEITLPLPSARILRAPMGLTDPDQPCMGLSSRLPMVQDTISTQPWALSCAGAALLLCWSPDLLFSGQTSSPHCRRASSPISWVGTLDPRYRPVSSPAAGTAPLDGPLCPTL